MRSLTEREKYCRDGKCPTCGKYAVEVGGAVLTLARTLKWYANPRNWKKDDWNVESVITHPDYGKPGHKARAALKRIAPLLEIAANRRGRKA